jgi:uncharacterized FlaG/YvyC family protein
MPDAARIAFERFLMEIPPIGGTRSGGAAVAEHSDSAQNDAVRNAFTAVRTLNNLGITDRKYDVVRDPSSQLLKIVVLDRETGTVLDQFPPEDILNMLAQLSSTDAKIPNEESQ